jgi:hypothetical protein
MRLGPRDGEPRRALPALEGEDEGGEVRRGAEDGREVVCVEGGGGEGVEEGLQGKVEEDGAEGTTLPHPTPRHHRLTRGEQDGAAEEGEGRTDERVAAKVAKDRFNGVMEKRVERRHKVHKGNTHPSRERLREPKHRPQLIREGRVERELTSR